MSSGLGPLFIELAVAGEVGGSCVVFRNDSAKNDVLQVQTQPSSGHWPPQRGNATTTLGGLMHVLEFRSCCTLFVVKFEQFKPLSTVLFPQR